MNTQVQDKHEIASSESIDSQINRIKSCKDETEVNTLLRALLSHFDIESYVYISMRRGEASGESFRYLIGCAPGWCQKYNAKKWFAIDPFIQYALRNSAPIVGSEIKPQTPGQIELLAAAAEHGFRSGMIIPAHSGNSARIGALYLGSTGRPEEVEPTLIKSRNQLRAIAMELFEWWEEKIRGEMLARYRIDDIDLQLLAFEQKGFTTSEGASLLGVTESLINGRFRRINDKLDVHHRKRAVERALELGILHA